MPGKLINPAGIFQLLLYALRRLSRGEPRQMLYAEVKDHLKELLHTPL